MSINFMNALTFSASSHFPISVYKLNNTINFLALISLHSKFPYALRAASSIVVLHNSVNLLEETTEVGQAKRVAFKEQSLKNKVKKIAHPGNRTPVSTVGGYYDTTTLDALNCPVEGNQACVGNKRFIQRLKKKGKIRVNRRVALVKSTDALKGGTGGPRWISGRNPLLLYGLILPLRRLVGRDNSTEEDAGNRINAQMSLDSKRTPADMVIDNTRSLHDLQERFALDMD
ncbi:hypothetical protein J1N35_021026 [Gossypium stocksii]|uniref:Uncharacterized protein n=1 Tax=Gossypium stocksii TaxID=47602 RepID=A0A9D4A1K3_9ROSI|nr:hypothetical protein J1N35_021026 [Gossypium stocksii]